MNILTIVGRNILTTKMYIYTSSSTGLTYSVRMRWTTLQRHIHICHSL